MIQLNSICFTQIVSPMGILCFIFTCRNCLILMNFGNFLRLAPQLFRTLNATTDVIYVTYHLSIRNIYTSNVTKLRFDKMAAAHGERVLVHLKSKDSDMFRKGDFTEVKILSFLKLLILYSFVISNQHICIQTMIRDECE